jgi:hypothetical protein
MNIKQRRKEREINRKEIRPSKGIMTKEYINFYMRRELYKVK